MSEIRPCVYCLEIAPLDCAHRGEMQRCPLCHTEILVCPTGASYRLRTDDGEPIAMPAAPTGHMALYAGIAGTATFAAIFWVIYTALPRPEGAVAQSPTLPLSLSGIDDVRVDEHPGDVLPYPRIHYVAQTAQAWPAPPAHGFAKGSGDTAALAAVKSEEAPFAPSPKPGPPVPPWEQGVPPLTTYSDSSINILLEGVPELTLQPLEKMSNVHSGDRATLATAHRDKTRLLVKSIHAANVKKVDGFIDQLIADRAEFAGLPFLRGGDCQLAAGKALTLQAAAFLVRAAAPAAGSSRSTKDSGAERFWYQWRQAYQDPRGFAKRVTPRGGTDVEALTENPAASTLPALFQILQGEAADFRLGLVQHLAGVDSSASSKALARLAIFDPDSEVRDLAIDVLRHRKRADYTSELMDGFRYPWPPAAARTAEAVVKLQRTDLVAALAPLLKQPDPDAPFVKKTADKETWLVREMVKVNHHRNCLLCHPPAAKPTDPVRGVVPSPFEPLSPSLSRAYYDDFRGDVFVRADVTYLRQDFSMLLPVKDVGRWPELQRFDFLVRTRAATAEDFEAMKRKADPHASPYRQAVLYALRCLTGRDNGPYFEGWREAALADRRWWAPCKP